MFNSKYIKYSITTAIVILVLIYMWQVDYVSVWEYITRIGWSSIGILIASGVAYLFATMAWQLCFTKAQSIEHRKPSLSKLYMIRQVGEALTMINPTNIVAGEMSKVYFLKKENIAMQQGTVSILLSRSFIILSYLTILLFGSLFWIITNSEFRYLLLPFLIIISAAIILLFFAILSPKLHLFGISQQLHKILSFNWLYKLSIGLKSANLQLARFYQNHKRKLLAVFALSALHWLIGTLEFYIILNAMDVSCTYMDALMMELGVMVFKSAGGFIPGQIGVEEYGNKVMLGMLGIPGSEVWVAVSVMRRIRQLAWVGISICFLFMLKRSFKKKNPINLS